MIPDIDFHLKTFSNGEVILSYFQMGEIWWLDSEEFFRQFPGRASVS